MTNWELFKRLCLIIGGQNGDSIVQVIDQGCFSRLTALAAERDLLPSLATRVDEHSGLIDRIPADSKEKLHTALAENTHRKLQIKAQAIKLARTLNTAGIEPLFLKGTARLLTNPDTPVGFRKQVDIDLLVPTSQIDETCEALRDDGYLFVDFGQPKPEFFSDMTRAHQISAHHHHLPPMVKQGYETTLELHKHPLSRQFRNALPLESLLQSAIARECHVAKFLVPSPRDQLMILTLGKFNYDGYAARYDFPLQAGADYIEIVNQLAAESLASMRTAGERESSTALRLFEQLVYELMGLPDRKRLHTPWRIDGRLKVMERRINSSAVSTALDFQARWRYLALSLLYDSGKMPAYVARQIRRMTRHSDTTGYR